VFDPSPVTLFHLVLTKSSTQWIFSVSQKTGNRELLWSLYKHMIYIDGLVVDLDTDFIRSFINADFKEECRMVLVIIEFRSRN